MGRCGSGIHFICGRKYRHSRHDFQSHRVLCGFVEYDVTDARFCFASPLVAIVYCKNWVSGAEQHHTTAAEICAASAPDLPLTSECGADLLYYMSRKVCLIRIDFRYRAFEADDYFSCSSGRNRFTQIYSQSCGLIVQGEV